MYPNKKDLAQLTEKCDLLCEHCFVSANGVGEEMSYVQIQNLILSRYRLD